MKNLRILVGMRNPQKSFLLFSIFFFFYQVLISVGVGWWKAIKEISKGSPLCKEERKKGKKTKKNIKHTERDGFDSRWLLRLWFEKWGGGDIREDFHFRKRNPVFLCSQVMSLPWKMEFLSIKENPLFFFSLFFLVVIYRRKSEFLFSLSRKSSHVQRFSRVVLLLHVWHMKVGEEFSLAIFRMNPSIII